MSLTRTPAELLAIRLPHLAHGRLARVSSEPAKWCRPCGAVGPRSGYSLALALPPITVRRARPRPSLPETEPPQSHGCRARNFAEIGAAGFLHRDGIAEGLRDIGWPE